MYWDLKKKKKEMLKSIGFITQRDYFLEWETVYYNVKNLYPNYKNHFCEFFNIINAKQKIEIKTTARKLGIEKILFKKISDISGGERQRIKILLLLLKSPSLILADEPTTSLDIKISKDIIKLLCEINNSSLMINIHNLELVPSGEYRIIAIKNKRIVFDGPMKKLSNKLIKEIYE
ncbi:ATP-binding cassette domain-containing protein [Candidatus Mycoplasma mahonii]|uniref:ATP-binding cassette domain-containing protein n=1 Tax=Candidatus Mycoplasma mahonii TaxID=3004105 RepID=UPI0026EC327B|nr:ATP-binding cassette domain-containing protein [Candidatus Mycoplasma mahonii]WKX02668.1 ATP-binding cassette domain-containing protein [Candidatus Mycoplasma mahonii]